jgi:hypothetical protein
VDEHDGLVALEARPDGLELGVAEEEAAVRRHDDDAGAAQVAHDVVDLGERALDVVPVGEGAEERDLAGGLVRELDALVVAGAREAAPLLARAGDGGARGGHAHDGDADAEGRGRVQRRVQ